MTKSTPAPPSPLVVALHAAAAAENAAIYGYSVAGAHLAEAQRAAARGDYDVHRAQLQAVTSWLAEQGAIAAPAQPVYRLPYAVTDPVSAASLLTALEEAAAAAYADVVAVATGDLQRASALALQSAAIRETHWRGSTVAFPGLVGRLPDSSPSSTPSQH